MSKCYTSPNPNKSYHVSPSKCHCGDTWDFSVTLLSVTAAILQIFLRLKRRLEMVLKKVQSLKVHLRKQQQERDGAQGTVL